MRTSEELDDVANTIVSQRVDDDARDDHCIYIPWAINSVALGQSIAKTLHVHPVIARFQTEQSLKKLQILSVENGHMTLWQYACVLSALPYVQSIHTVCFTGRGSWMFTELQLSWLAYVLSHPRMKTSTWKKLVLDKVDLRYAMDTIKKMASRDRTPLLSATKLAALMETNFVKNRNGFGYVPYNRLPVERGDRLRPRVATVKSETVVYGDADTDFVLCCVQSDMELEICYFKTETRRCVLVPGFGVGWVLHHDVVDPKNWVAASGLPSMISLEVGSELPKE